MSNGDKSGLDSGKIQGGFDKNSKASSVSVDEGGRDENGHPTNCHCDPSCCISKLGERPGQGGRGQNVHSHNVRRQAPYPFH